MTDKLLIDTLNLDPNKQTNKQNNETTRFQFHAFHHLRLCNSLQNDNFVLQQLHTLLTSKTHFWGWGGGGGVGGGGGLQDLKDVDLSSVTLWNNVFFYPDQELNPETWVVNCCVFQSQITQ